jgi:hypothetical protein
MCVYVTIYPTNILKIRFKLYEFFATKNDKCQDLSMNI